MTNDGSLPDHIENPELEHSQEQLNQLYSYLIDTYGVDNQYEQMALSSSPLEWPTLPKLTGMAAVKAALFGDKRPQPKPSPPDMYTITERIVDMPMPPARNPNDTRCATIRRRQYPKAGPTILFQSKSVRTESEAKARNVGQETIDTTPSGVLHRLLGKDVIEAETGSLWFDYLSKVKDYRDSGQYDEEGYGPFIEQNHDLLVAMEVAMGFTESDREIKLAQKRQYDKEQLALTQQFIENWLSGLNFSEWVHVPDYGGDYISTSYDTRSRGVRLSSTSDAEMPTLTIKEVQQTGAALYPGTGIATTYLFDLRRGKDVVVGTDFYDNLRPDIPPYRDVNVIVDSLANKLASELLGEESVQAARGQVAELNTPLSIPVSEQSRILLRALWNEVMKIYTNFDPENITP